MHAWKKALLFGISSTFVIVKFFQNSVGASHPVMHKLLQEDVSKYIEKNPGITYFFQRLADAGKKLFLVTNSPYKFV